MFPFNFKKSESPFCSAVVVAAGDSTRMGEDKILMELGGLPLIVRTLRALQRSDYIDEIVLVTKSEKIPYLCELTRNFEFDKVLHFVTGGRTRTESALAGVQLCSEKAELIAIHDGARPFIDEELISRTVLAAAEHGAAAPGIPPRDTVRQSLAGMATKTYDRDTLRLMQTPQVFKSELIRSSLENAARLGLKLTDDCEAVMFEGAEVCIVDGDEKNIKLTTSADIAVARALIEEFGLW